MLSDNKFKNPALEAETAKIEAEFNRILKSGNSPTASPRRGGNPADADRDGFYKLMGEFYSSDMKRHVSPTKRLIKQKNSTWEHKALLQHHHDDKYGLHYTASPGKSYYIKPEGGELNYDLAYKDPLGFYDQVMTGNVIEHKAKDTGVKCADGIHHEVMLTTRLTHRKIGKILLIVQNQLCEFFEGKWRPADVKAAFADTHIKESLKQHINDGSLKLVHRTTGEKFDLEDIEAIP